MVSMVNLTKIYTRLGDQGQTHLVNMEFTSKTDPRVAAYGDVDEANSIIGIVRTQGIATTLDEVLAHCQNELFDVGADLATPYEVEPQWEPLRITQNSIDRLEGWCDEFSADLPNLKSFILPGGTPAAAFLNLARTVIRRAERQAWQAAQNYGLSPDPGGVNKLAIQYLNRMSDLLFVLGRYCNLGENAEILWVPGADRNPPDKKADKQRNRILDSQK